MPNHLFLMSFNGDSVLKLFKNLNRFFEYIFFIANRKKINFCYIGTASNDNVFERLFFHSFLRLKFGLRINFTYLALNENITEGDILKLFSQQDILFIGPGNTERMLKVWERSGLINVLNQLKSSNKLPILAGVSAGGMYPFHSGFSDSLTEQFKPLKCLEWINASFCPHADYINLESKINEKKLLNDRFSAYKTAIKDGQIPAGYALPDDCMMHFYDDKLVGSLSIDATRHCIYVNKTEVKKVETTHLTDINISQNANAALRKLGHPMLDTTPYQSNSLIRLIFKPSIYSASYVQFLITCCLVH